MAATRQCPFYDSIEKNVILQYENPSSHNLGNRVPPQKISDKFTKRVYMSVKGKHLLFLAIRHDNLL